MWHLIFMLLLATGCPGKDDTGGECPDTDGDTVCDDVDMCQGDDAAGDADLDGICDGPNDLCFGDDSTQDTDGDGLCDDVDLCDGDDTLTDADNDGLCDGELDACFGDDASGDSDADGVCDDRDLCDGNDSTGDTDGDGSCDDSDLCTGNDQTLDTDSDGVCDDQDLCTGNDTTGDSDADGSCDDSDLCLGNDQTLDADNDGVCGDLDACPGEDDATADTDDDGVCNSVDVCLGDDSTGDTDSDSVCDDLDQCVGNDDTPDTDGDGICEDIDQCTGDDASPDSDGDGVCEDIDLCTGDDATSDSDGDSVCDDLDQCAGNDANPDTDGDGVCEDIDLCNGNDASGDSDSDGLCDDLDLCGDEDGDGDGDGVCDGADRCDGDDGIGDYDNDGLCDDLDPCGGFPNDDEDVDGICDGVRDVCFGLDSTGDRDGDTICDDLDLCYGDDHYGDDDGNEICGSGVIRYVDATSTATESMGRFWGLSWENAYPSLQDAYEPTRYGDTVFVRTPPDGTLHRTDFARFTTHEQLIGGFLGTESHPDERPIDPTTQLPIPTPLAPEVAGESIQRVSISGAYMDAFSLNGFTNRGVEAGSEARLNNLHVVSAGTPDGTVFVPSVITFLGADNATGTHIRCEGFDSSQSGCISVQSGSVRLVYPQLHDITTPTPVALISIIGGRSLDVVQMTATNLAARLFRVRAVYANVVDSDISDNAFVMDRGILSAENTFNGITFSDTRIANNTVTGPIVLEGGLFHTQSAELTFRRTTISDTTLIGAQRLIGGVVYNDRAFQLFDSAIYGTSAPDSVDIRGGILHLSGSNSWLVGSSLHALASPGTGAGVNGALLWVDGPGYTRVHNVAMWTPHDVPFATDGRDTIAWQAVCGPAALADSPRGPASFLALTASPFAPVVDERLYLDPSSVCVDAGLAELSDAWDIWWPKRTALSGGTRDLGPTDLGAHYNP